ncbi:hypothetical protein BQ8482_800005 [Mesorhizobium delmotii]|uniref:Uncharacterized protein n=1 Tax=Mesorhizobium delmotii TaxID=1631247 RepID=A0A2P9AWU3_9HYPH|nr:hypothetical protein BQ8482_800005 [Mesorhizobium delmotii]
MRGAIRLDAACQANPLFVLLLHEEQKLLRMIVRRFIIDQAMVLGAEEHQVRNILGEQRGPDRMTACAIGGVRHDMRNETEHFVFFARQQFTDEFAVAAAILTAPCRPCPERTLDLVVNFGLCHSIDPSK